MVLAAAGSVLVVVEQTPLPLWVPLVVGGTALIFSVARVGAGSGGEPVVTIAWTAAIGLVVFWTLLQGALSRWGGWGCAPSWPGWLPLIAVVAAGLMFLIAGSYEVKRRRRQPDGRCARCAADLYAAHTPNRQRYVSDAREARRSGGEQREEGTGEQWRAERHGGRLSGRP